MVISLAPLAAIEAARTELLLDMAFGSDRHLRTAYAIRAGTRFEPACSFAAIENDDLIGVIQSWPIQLAKDAGGYVPLMMVGPVAVLPNRQGDGVGRTLMTHMLAQAAKNAHDRALMLIGDPEYYGRFFGFTADQTARWRAPGPVEQRRLLARGPDVPDAAGMLGPRIAALA